MTLQQSNELRDGILRLLQETQGELTTEQVAQAVGHTVDATRYELNVLWEGAVVGRRTLDGDGTKGWQLVEREVGRQKALPVLVAPKPRALQPVKMAPVVPKFYMVRELVDMARSGRLNLRPYFQRAIVWKDDAKGYLLDSILKGYPIPEVFTYVNEATGTLDVIDGQQRLNSVLEFAADGLAVQGWGRFRSLSPTMKKFFLEYPITIREISGGVGDEEVRSIFRRLNTNIVPLAAQELRHAIFTGRFVRLVDRLAEDQYWTESKVVSRAEARRMRTSEFISELLIAIKEGAQDGKYRLTETYERYESEFTEKQEELWEGRFIKTLLLTKSLAGGIARNNWRAKYNFYPLFLALYSKRNELPPSRYDDVSNRLLAFIYEFKHHVRQPSQDPLVVSYFEVHSRWGFDHRDNRLARMRILLEVLKPFTEGSK